VRLQRKINEFVKLISRCSYMTGSTAAAVLLFGSSVAYGTSPQDVDWVATQYATLGNPTSAIATSDGKYVFVSVTNVGAPNFAGPDSAASARRDVVSGIHTHHKNADIHLQADNSIKSFIINNLNILRAAK
jgi:hypothetical protein